MPLDSTSLTLFGGFLLLFVCLFFFSFININHIKLYKILHKLSPKHATRGVAQSPLPIYSHRKAYLSKQ